MALIAFMRMWKSTLLAGALSVALPGALAGPDHGESAGEVHCDGEALEDYNMTLAITSVFVVWILSLAGAAFPTILALKRHPYIILAIKMGEYTLQTTPLQ